MVAFAIWPLTEALSKNGQRSKYVKLEPRAQLQLISPGQSSKGVTHVTIVLLFSRLGHGRVTSTGLAARAVKWAKGLMSGPYVRRH